jgi:uncharacterized repeat protein (TIGR01451 family)
MDMFSGNIRAGLLLAALMGGSAAMAGGNPVLIDEDFTGFTGAGFTPTPAAGQLDSDVWIVQGMSDQSAPAFGDSLTSGDFTRGASSGGVTSGGIYAFDTGGNTILGAQPTGSDFTPGSIDLQTINLSGNVASALFIQYDIWVLNNATRANSINLEFSTDGVSWTPIPDLDYITPEADDTLGWVQTARSITLTGLSIADGSPFFLRWASNDETGGGSRDEFGIDNVRVEVVPAPDLVISKTGPEYAVAGEQIRYQIGLENFSITDPITGLTVTDDLPPNTSYVSDTSGVTPDQSVPGVLTWSFADLPVGANADFELVVAIDPAAPNGLLLNTIGASGQAGALPVNVDANWETTVVSDVSIYDIQTVADPSIDDASPLLGETVRVDGVLTVVPGELEDNRPVVISVIQESAGGPFSGLVLIGDLALPDLERGDEIRVFGEVAENFGQTELTISSAEFIQTASLPAAELLMTSAFATGTPVDAPSSEQWEGVLIEFTDVTVTDDGLGFGEWLFDDGSGNARGDDAGVALSIVPALNDSYDFLRGVGWFSFGNFKIQPRNNSDVGLVADLFTIEAIQGNGLRSPFAPPTGTGPGQIVRTEGNIVTAVGPNFFVIQMPDPVVPRGELAPASRGLNVFTGSTPTVQVGDEVTVQGAVVEFFELTQIGLPDLVEVTGSGNPLPTPIVFDDQIPSADPETPSCVINNFECFESMRVSVANGFVTAPSQSFGSDPVAEAVVSASGGRILRGPGVEFPGIDPLICPNCPVWSGAPEQFELDPDRIALANVTLAGGTTFSATGVIGFEFGDYELWPTELTIDSTPTLPDPAPVAAPDELSIASLNALNLFDDVDDPDRPIPTCNAGFIAENRVILSPAEYQLKLQKLADTIVIGMGLPDVIALQEVESLATLQALAQQVGALRGEVNYTAYLIPGNDRGEINNGFLINESRVAVDAVFQEGGDECLSTDNTPLHDRPTLTLEARFIAEGANWPFVVMNNHLRSLGGVDAEARVRLKRHEQAQSVAARVQARQQADADLPVVVIGDMNAFEFSDGFVDVVGLISGTAVENQNLVNIENGGVPGFNPSNQVSPALFNALDSLLAEERYSFIFRGVAQTLDHALLNRAASRFASEFGFARGNADVWEGFEGDPTPLRASDHDGLVLILEPGRDLDALFRDRFEQAP